MRHLQNSALLAWISVVLSCAKITIKDIPLYWDAGTDGAITTHLLSEQTSDVAKATWDIQRFGYVCVSPDDFAWLRETLEKLCVASDVACGTDEKRSMKAFFQRSDRAKYRVNLKKRGS